MKKFSCEKVQNSENTIQWWVKTGLAIGQTGQSESYLDTYISPGMFSVYLSKFSMIYICSLQKLNHNFHFVHLVAWFLLF